MLTVMANQEPCSAAALQRGEMDALTCYCFRYLRPLTRYTLYLIKDQTVADSLVSKTLEHLWHNRTEMVNERAVHKFLLSDIRRGCITWVNEQLIATGMVNPNKAKHLTGKPKS